MTIQVTDSNAKEVMQQIVRDGQEDGFFICDVSDIVAKYYKWINVMPRVKPFYGKFFRNTIFIIIIIIITQCAL